MAPFLVILLLLALGAGIIAWHTTGPAFRRSGPPPRPVVKATIPQEAPSTSNDLVAAPEPEPLFRPADPFAHVPAPLDREHFH